MTKKRKKPVENPSGIGKVFRDDGYLSDVRYRLRVVQEILIAASFAGEEEIEGLREITGDIDVIKGEGNLISDEQLTLQLEDGRTWKFITKSGDPLSARYQVMNASGEGLVQTK